MSTNQEAKELALEEIKASHGQTGDLKPDAAIAALEHAPAAILQLSPEERRKLERRVVRKIDGWLMPPLMVMYILNYLDRNNIAVAKLYGLPEDLGLVGAQYQTAVAILNLLAAAISRPAWWICFTMFSWGVLSACTALVNNFAGIIVIRILLGACEAAFFPGATFLLSCFYTKKELAGRTALLFSGSQLGNAFGTLLARAILELDGAHGLAGWKWLFIVEGVATVGLAIIFATFLPNLPKNMWQLKPIEREMAMWRLELESGSTETPVKSWDAFVSCIVDMKVWAFVGILSLTYVAGAINSFFPSVVKTLGYDDNLTLVLTAPPFLLCVVVMLFNGWWSDRRNSRYLHVVGPIGVTIVALIIALSTLNTGARYFAMMLLPSSFYSSAIVQFAWISQTIARPNSKRAATLALVNSIGNTPNLWSAYLYQDYMQPRYAGAFACSLAACVCAVGVATWLRWYLQRQNRKMDQGMHVGGGVTEEMQEMGWRYTL